MSIKACGISAKAGWLASLERVRVARLRRMHRSHLLLISALAIGCAKEGSPAADSGGALPLHDTVAAASSSPNCDPARGVVEQLGAQMRLVSVLAPDATVRRDLADAYGDLVTPELLAKWQAAPRSAPGRTVSSPWPARIAIRDVKTDGSACVVDGEIISVTSADTVTALDRQPVTLRLEKSDRWRVTAYETGASSSASAAPSPPSTATDSAPANVVRQYYADIAARRYAAAYERWGRGGSASGKPEAEFARGFSDTKTVAVTVGDSTTIEGAAGSQYATIPVRVDATLTSGAHQHFEGSYTLRRAMVDGASAVDRRWHIERAELRQR
jgi:hypothetical protein